MSRRAWTTLIAVVAGLVAFNVVLHYVSRYTRDPGGRESSSYATQPAGVAAWAELLARFDRDVDRLREPLRDAELDPRSAVIVLDPEVLSEPDADALRSFAEGGGRVIAGGSPPGDWVDVLTGGDAPEWDPQGLESGRPRAAIPEFRAVRRVAAAGRGSWRERGALGAGPRSLLVVRRAELGRVLLLADTSPVQNALLDEADNAAFALALAGDRRVVFVESLRGAGREIGLAAIPVRWWWMLGGLGLAAIVFVVGRGRRFGPPELASRPLPPPRRDYVDAIALHLARTKRPTEAAQSVQDEIRRLLRRGATSREERALAPVRTDAELVEAVRAVARLRRAETGRR